jgi:CRISPR/Cas system-associated exonuclease Cas4 (RecB family)
LVDKQQCTSAVLEINIKDILDYCWCPKYYELKNNNPNEQNLKEAYDVALHKCFYQYLLALQNDTLDGLKTLKYRWGQEWIKQRKNSEIICTPSALKRDTYDAKRKAGIDAIITFDKLMKTPQFPILINKQYSLKITDDIVITGTWEYVREIEIDGQKVIQLMKFRTENNRFQVLSQMNHDLELTAAALAFSKTFNINQAEFQLVYVDIYKNKMMSSYRNIKDFELLKETVISVVQCIKNKIRCISPDKKCYHCEYRDICTTSLGG